MRALGIATTAAIAAVGALAAFTGFRSIADIKRYLKMRSM